MDRQQIHGSRAHTCKKPGRTCRTKTGIPPLIIAAREGNADFTKLLIASGADVNIADNLQHTALHYAAERGYNPIVEMLLASGAEG